MLHQIELNGRACGRVCVRTRFHQQKFNAILAKVGGFSPIVVDSIFKVNAWPNHRHKKSAFCNLFWTWIATRSPPPALMFSFKEREKKWRWTRTTFKRKVSMYTFSFGFFQCLFINANNAFASLMCVCSWWFTTMNNLKAAIKYIRMRRTEIHFALALCYDKVVFFVPFHFTPYPFFSSIRAHFYSRWTEAKKIHTRFFFLLLPLLVRHLFISFIWFLSWISRWPIWERSQFARTPFEK